MIYTIRALTEEDLDWAHDLNQQHAVALSSLSCEAFAALTRRATRAAVVDEKAAFLLAFDQDADYDSPNFLWFKARFPRFLYVDRVVVSAAHRRKGLARKLYNDLFVAAAAAGHDSVVCEVNAVPPNPSSDAFHDSLGFTLVAREGLGDSGKVVSYLRCRLPPSGISRLS